MDDIIITKCELICTTCGDNPWTCPHGPSHAAELQDAIDAWRGLTEEQRQDFYEHGEDTYRGNAAVSPVALRLLKAAARK